MSIVLPTFNSFVPPQLYQVDAANTESVDEEQKLEEAGNRNPDPSFNPMKITMCCSLSPMGF